MHVDRRSVNERLRTLDEPFAELLGTYALERDGDACDRLRAWERIVHACHVHGASILAARDGRVVVQK